MKHFFKFHGAIAFAALTGLFSSCTFDVDPICPPGEAKINVTVTYLFDGSDVTSSSQVKVSTDTPSDNTISYAGGVISIKASENGKIINPQKITVSASYTNTSGTYTGTATYSVPFIKYNESHQGAVNIVLGPAPEGYAERVKGDPVKDVKYAYLAKAHYEKDGKMWMENATSVWLSGLETCTYLSGAKVENFDAITDANVRKFAKARNTGVVKENREKAFTVSAWSIYCLEMAYTTSAQTWEVYQYSNAGDIKVVGTYVVDTYSSTEKYYEEAHPSHAGHYIHGHGHSHGDAAHAGGGIIIAD